MDGECFGIDTLNPLCRLSSPTPFPYVAVKKKKEKKEEKKKNSDEGNTDDKIPVRFQAAKQ
jgi:hypothetical protein